MPLPANANPPSTAWQGNTCPACGFGGHPGRALAGLFDSEPKHLMLISKAAAPGLQPTAKPDLSSVPNNHLSYAVQWFLFALVASVIYVLALRWRQKPKA